MLLLKTPFGNDLASAQALNKILLSAFDEKAVYRIDHYLAKRQVHNLVFFRFTNSFLERIWTRHYIESMQITMAEDFGVRGRGSFYDETGEIRDGIQNHLFQVLCNLTMEPSVRTDSESIRDEKVKVLKATRPLEIRNLVRGQFHGYRKEPGVVADSKVETFAALKLEIDSWRWRGVPFYIRADKSLAVTCTEIMIRMLQPPTMYQDSNLKSNYFRLRLIPEITIALGINFMAPGSESVAESAEIIGSRHPGVQETDERVLTDAMAGDSTLFARQDMWKRRGAS